MQAVYLDVCSLCRPFDDQSFLRIRLETDAVNLVLAKIHRKNLQLLVSPVHFLEIKDIPDLSERVEIETLLANEAQQIKTDLESVRSRTEELIEKGIGIADAAHVAFAESSNADFVTCDDKLLKKCIKIKVKIWVGTPIAFCDKEALK